MKARSIKALSILLTVISMASYVQMVRRMMFSDSTCVSVDGATMYYLQMWATLMLCIAIVAIGIVYYSWVLTSRLAEHIKNILLTGVVVVMSLLCAECFFLHYARSNAFGERWSYKLWDRKYINHRTNFDYKTANGRPARADFREPVIPPKKNKKKVWFIGDSFTFGFGIEQTAWTFPLVTQKLLLDSIDAVNLGMGGADTYREKEILTAYGQAVGRLPYAVVWQYFGNDIDSADLGPDIYDRQFSESKWGRVGKRFFREKSFLLDYIYWEYFAHNELTAKNVYIDFLSKLYTADSIVVDGTILKDSLGVLSPYRKHLQPLKEAAAYYKSKGVKFLVIIFPFLWKDGPEQAERLYAHRLEQELISDHTDVIDLTPLLQGVPLDKREVNTHDLHPSPLIDGMVADTIAKFMKANYSL